MRSLINILDLSTDELDELIAVAMDIINNPAKYSEACKGKKLATLFFEPSTRTRLSFEAAMYELGGNVLSVAGADTSSAAKGESVADTAKVISCYADIIAMRHSKEGAPLVAAMNATVPVINAGDGGHNHPTQTLADLLTIYREKGRLGNMTVGLCGDLKFGRTVHSLIAALSRYQGVRFVLISPEELKLPEYVENDIRAVVDAAGDVPVKTILEVGYLTDDQIRRASEIVVKAGAVFVKTGTGWGPRPTTVQDIRLIKETIGDSAYIKAAGGVHSLAVMQEMAAAGCNRFGIGVRTAEKIIEEAKNC